MRVCLITDGFRVWLYTVNSYDFQPLRHLHVVGIVVNRITDGIGRVVIRLYCGHQLTHFGCYQTLGRFHHGSVFHYVLKYQGL